MNNNIGGLVSNLKQSNMQNTMRELSQFPLLDVNRGTMLSGYFYEFLLGKSNKLPTHEFLSKITALAQYDLETISIGYGMIISKNLTLTIDTLLEDERRTDRITADSYSAYKYDSSSTRAIDIDVEKYPLFNISRIKAVQNYLTEYKKFIMPNENENTNSGMKR